MTRDRDERQLRVMMHDLADLLVVVVPPAPPEPEIEFSQREVAARRGSARRES